MILEVQHETKLVYSELVSEWISEVRMEPASDEAQTCHSFHLAVSQPTPLFRYRDGFGNRVHHFSLLTPDLEVRVLAASIVETRCAPVDLTAGIARYPVALDDAALELFDFLSFQGPVRRTPKLEPILDSLRPRNGDHLGAIVVRVREYIHDHFEYAREVTNASSPIDDLLEHGKGVCQDFAHLMSALLRSFGIPARYVSGYIHRENQESQSHAWCEAWIPDLGWVGVDPTNNCVVDDHFVKVAVGRDFTDVSPNKGVFRGRSDEAIFARVETRALDRLPSLSWQEQLPPLCVPLTAIRLRKQAALVAEEEAEQQQQ